MPTTINQSQYPRGTKDEILRSGPQKVCLTIGIFFVVIGVSGVMLPGLLGMHLSPAHNLIHILTGIFSLSAAYSIKRSRAFNFCLAFGLIYSLLGLSGFLIGVPGYPSVGYMGADQNLFQVLPGVLEFGTIDHFVHIFLGAIFLIAAFVWRKEKISNNSSR